MTKTTQLIVAALALVAVWWFFMRKPAATGCRGCGPIGTKPVSIAPGDADTREPVPTAISDLGAPATGGIASIPVSSRFIHLD